MLDCFSPHLALTALMAGFTVQGAVTVVALSVPLVPSLLMLLRLMSARSYATVTLQSAYMLVEEQADLMATGQNPNVPYAELSVRPIEYTSCKICSNVQL